MQIMGLRDLAWRQSKKAGISYDEIETIVKCKALIYPLDLEHAKKMILQ